MKVYEIKTRGGTFRVQLSDEDAKRRGLTPVEPESKKATPANKARTAGNKK